MAVLALDLGTTKICALVMDNADGTVLETRSADNAFLPSRHPFDRQQDPEQIFGTVETLVSQLKQIYGVFSCIGISCQMHGILYVNAAGRAVSSLYTWQDQCASRHYLNGETYAGYLSKFSPGPLAPGYGLASCFYHLSNNVVPSDAVKLCTIGDYIGMRLCNARLPVMHSTNAGGMGFFDVINSRFDTSAMEKAGLKLSLLPELYSGYDVLGETTEGSPVSAAIGDNQASFLGAVREPGESISVNIGTGSQISLVSSDPEGFNTLEVRPFFNGLFLLAGASLCGGRAYAILETFFRRVLNMAGLNNDNSLYPFMNALAVTGENPGEDLSVSTLFAGSRANPLLRGSIMNISEDNFTPSQLVTGFLKGIVDELYNFYAPVKEQKGNCHKTLVGSGNAIRRNEALRKILSEKFALPLALPPYQEEAAYGAALYALTSTGKTISRQNAQ